MCYFFIAKQSHIHHTDLIVRNHRFRIDVEIVLASALIAEASCAQLYRVQISHAVDLKSSKRSHNCTVKHTAVAPTHLPSLS